MRRLSVAQQQVVEIVKALSLDARILVMDEPTAALADHEVELLFALVRRLQERGIGMLYISHRLREVFALADRITVLKDGGLVKTLATSETDSRELVHLMVGRELDGYFPPRGEPGDLGEVRLACRGAVDGRCCATSSLEVRAGEIVGLAGLQGSGRTELARAIFGADPFTAGTIELDGKPRRFRSPRAAMRAGLGFVTEDRKLEGLALAQSVADNTLLAVRTVIPGARRRRSTPGLMSVKELAAVTELRARGPEQEVRFLSGGNQQKVVLAKWLADAAADPDLRRADARHRRRRQGRHPRPDPQAGEGGRRRPDDLVRAAGADRHERPHPRHARGHDRRRAARRRGRGGDHAPRDGPQEAAA